tara:strand:- start:1993 stop:3267 length:1275 start_codon:yes stop_codon:yes gene_type:complete
MDESLFKEIVEKWVSTANASLEDKSKEANYLYNSLLRLQMSIDHKFSAVSGKNNRVAADIVAMDSDLPLKSRGSMETYNGKIPKVGLQRYLTESQLSELDILISKNVPESTIAAKIFDDYMSNVTGAREKVEYMLHQAMSNGLVEIPNDENTGTSIRVDFGIPDANRYGVTKVWSDPTADIAGDLERIYEKSVDMGDNIVLARMDRKTFNYIKKNESVIALYKGSINASNDSAVTLNADKITELFQSEYNFAIQVIDRSFEIEKNGVTQNVRAWAEGAVSFWTTTGVVGDLWYADLAEKSRPVKTKTYSQPETWMLAAKWSEGNPLREFTEASGLVMPVLNNVDHIYFLDTNEATASLDEQTEGDAVYSYKGTDYTKASVVAGLNAAGAPNSTVSQQDATLSKKIDGLSEEGVKTFEAELVESA